MKKPKGETIELLYSNKSNTKNKSNKSGKSKKTKNDNNTKINLDNEIIIGLTPKSEKNVTSKKKNKKSTSASKNKVEKSKKKKNKTKKTVTEKRKNNKKQSKKSKVRIKIFKWTSISIFAICTIILFMMSNIFNIKQIAVLNNNKISSEEIVELSGLTVGTNMFKTRKSVIRNKVKTNAYIENVQTKRSLNGKTY